MINITANAKMTVTHNWRNTAFTALLQLVSAVAARSVVEVTVTECQPLSHQLSDGVLYPLLYIFILTTHILITFSYTTFYGGSHLRASDLRIYHLSTALSYCAIVR